VQCDDTDMVVFFNTTALNERTVANYNNRSYVLKWGGSSSASCMHIGGAPGSYAATGGLSSDGGYTSTFSMHANFKFDGERCGVTVHSDIPISTTTILLPLHMEKIQMLISYVKNMMSTMYSVTETEQSKKNLTETVSTSSPELMEQKLKIIRSISISHSHTRI